MPGSPGSVVAKEQKTVKIQRSTGILLGVAISLTATIAIVETQRSQQSNGGDTLFDFAEADVSAFIVERDGETLAFTKIDNSWQMTEPEETLADPSSVAFLLNIITNDTVSETLTISSNELATYGLETPKAMVSLSVDGKDHILTVGDADFSGTSLYVMTASDVTESEPVKVLLIPQGIENGIERPVDDWIAKSENESASPDAADTVEPIPESENSASSENEAPENPVDTAE